MKRLIKFIGPITAAISMIAAPTLVSADDKDVVEYREHIMNALSEQTGALGQVMSGAAPEENFVTHIEIIALLASTALKSFEAKVAGGESKPEVWDKWPDFSARMNTFAAATAKLAQTAKENGKDAAMGELVTALSCKSCHDVYRNEAKK